MRSGSLKKKKQKKNTAEGKGADLRSVVPQRKVTWHHLIAKADHN